MDEPYSTIKTTVAL